MTTTQAPATCRPVTLTAPEVRAALGAGRVLIVRPVKLPSEWGIPPARYDRETGRLNRWGCHPGSESVSCPFGRPGDGLWCRETWEYADDSTLTALYRADMRMDEAEVSWSWRSPATMPRRLSRLALTVESVAVRRLQSVTENEAKAAGTKLPVTQYGNPLVRVSGKFCPQEYVPTDVLQPGLPEHAWTARCHFAGDWDARHGAGAWASDSWVWVAWAKRTESGGG